MRYNEFNESTSISRMEEMMAKETKIIMQKFEEIQRDCKPFLEAINHDVPNNVLYRGMDDVPKLGTKTARLDSRKPTDSHRADHNDLNNYFNQKYGHPYRNGVFATGAFNMASGYGSVVAMFPIGNFEYIWHKKIMDVYSNILKPSFGQANIYWAKYAQSINADIDIGRMDAVADWAKTRKPTELLDFMGDYRMNQNLIAGLKSANEIMVWTEKYHFISYRFLNRWNKVNEI